MNDDDLSKILVRNYSNYPFIVKEALGINDDHKRQFFEVLVSFLLSQIKNDYRWLKKGSSGDGGIDFEAIKVIADFNNNESEKYNFSIPIKNIKFWLGGQSKYRSSKESAIKARIQLLSATLTQLGSIQQFIKDNCWLSELEALPRT